MAVKVSGLKINEKDLMCKNQCGFFGNPSWHYYCSVCYRDVYLKKNFQNKSISTEVSQSSISSFSKFEEKRKAVSSKTPNTVKNIFKANTKIDDTREEATDSKEAKLRFEQFLLKLKKSVMVDVQKQVKIHLDALEDTKFVKIDQHSHLIQNFYERMFERFHSENIYKVLNDKQTEELISEIERYLTIQIYDWAFKPYISDDEVIDLKLQKKIRSFHWITSDILDAEIDENDPNEISHYYDAIDAIIEMNTVLCPEDKLNCIVRCCKSVFAMLQTHANNIHTKEQQSTANGTSSSQSNKVVNADDFLPALIFILIRANPTLLHSNIQFITRFARPSLINSGEIGYMFTNVCVALEFINNLDNKALNMTKPDYDDAMKGIRFPSKHSNSVLEQHTVEAKFAALRILDNNEQFLNKLEVESEAVRNNLIQLDNEINAYDQVFQQKLDRIKSETPLKFNLDYNGDLSHDEKINKTDHPDLDTLFAENPDAINTELPSPLAPIKSNLVTDKENWDLFLK